MKNKILKLFTISFLLNVFSPIGLLINLSLVKNELIALLLIFTWLVGVVMSLTVSLSLGKVKFEKEALLDEEIKKTRSRYDDNELFIKALNNIIVRKAITLKEIKVEHEKLKTKLK